jgi:hypothetical protein
VSAKLKLTGATFHLWTVLGQGEPPAHILRHAYRVQTWWRCRCECGTEKTVSAGSLRIGSRSCGCLRDAASRARLRSRDQAA